MPTVDTASVERRLRERQVELHAKRAALMKAPERGSGISFGKRVGDGTTEAVSRLNDVGIVDSLSASMERVDRALAKLAEGTYGTCDACGKAIPAPRLEAQPESAACVGLRPLRAPRSLTAACSRRSKVAPSGA